MSNVHCAFPIDRPPPTVSGAGSPFSPAHSESPSQRRTRATPPASRPASVPDPYWRGNVGQWFEDAGLKFESCRYALEDKVLSFRKANIQERLAALIGNTGTGRHEQRVSGWVWRGVPVFI